ncbi:MAG: hypothetical protein JXQ83_03325 [Candidatus Glassbacteria bacterium]|nr:hypothetical protein [Candidatus Glassbacteria bacterium]
MEGKVLNKALRAGLLGAVLLTLCCGQDNLTYTDEKNGYRVDYKPGWEMQQVDISMVFLSPKEGEDDRFQEAVNVVVQDLNSMPMTLEELTNHMKDYLHKANATIVESGKRSLGGSEGYLLVVSGKQGEMELKMMQVYTIAGGKAYIVTYTAETDKYDQYFKDAEIMFGSFEML